MDNYNKDDPQSCKFCGRICKNRNSLVQHELRCKCNPNKIPSISKQCIEAAHLALRGKPSWNHGLTKETDERVAKQAKAEHDGYVTGRLKPSFLGKHHTPEVRAILSKGALDKNFAQHFGVRHTWEYNGLTFISSYEVEVVKDLDKNNIRWEIPQYGLFKYHAPNNSIHTYTPDIYLPDYDVYLDPKNDYLINNVNPTLGYKDVDKIQWVMNENHVRIIVLNKHQLTWDEIKKLILVESV